MPVRPEITNNFARIESPREARDATRSVRVSYSPPPFPSTAPLFLPFLHAPPAGGSRNPPLRGRILGTLFYENSTRTACSFQAAMLRLGGTFVSVDAASSSIKKGETLEVRCGASCRGRGERAARLFCRLGNQDCVHVKWFGMRRVGMLSPDMSAAGSLRAAVVGGAKPFLERERERKRERENRHAKETKLEKLREM